jgi:HSP20 family molecular chaperone IbpA
MTYLTKSKYKTADTWSAADEFDNIFKSAFLRTSTSLREYEVFEHEAAYVVAINLPGQVPDSFDVEVEGSVLTVVSDSISYGGKRLVGVAPAASSTFTVTLPFTPSTTAPEAVYAQGVLKIHFPKRQADRRRRIEVKVGE